MAEDAAEDPKYRDDPALVAYAAERGLYYERVRMPPHDTQLLRHGSFQEAWNGMRGTLPGGLDGQLMHWDYGDVQKPDRYTIVLAQIPESVKLASRLVCHDRSLPDDARADPEAGARTVNLDDQAVRLESDAFLRRYTLATDHDTDQNAVWQLFSPEFIEWLTTAAPAGLSFEIQDGTLCAFHAGSLVDAGALDGLCEAAAAIASRVRAECEEREAADLAPGAATVAGSRDEILEHELAEASFDSVPKDVKHAANAFRAGPIRTDRSWRLGEEAFFRAYATTLGLEAADASAYRAKHLNLGFPGRLAHVAAGTIEWLGAPGYLVFSDLEDGDANGWCSLVVELPLRADPSTFASVNDACFKRSCFIFWDGAAASLCQEGRGRRTRTKADLDEFVEFARANLPALVGAA